MLVAVLLFFLLSLLLLLLLLLLPLLSSSLFAVAVVTVVDAVVGATTVVAAAFVVVTAATVVVVIICCCYCCCCWCFSFCCCHCCPGGGGGGFVLLLMYNLLFLVQSQYVFIYDALNEAVSCGVTEVEAKKFSGRLRELREVDPNTGRSYMEKEFLRLVKDERHPSTFKNANLGINSSKNRYANILPCEYPLDDGNTSFCFELIFSYFRQATSFSRVSLLC